MRAVPEKQVQTRTVPARDVRAGMFLFLRSDNRSYEVTDRTSVGKLYVSFLLENGGHVLKGLDDLVHVVVMNYEF